MIALCFYSDLPERSPHLLRLAHPPLSWVSIQPSQQQHTFPDFLLAFFHGGSCVVYMMFSGFHSTRLTSGPSLSPHPTPPEGCLDSCSASPPPFSSALKSSLSPALSGSQLCCCRSSSGSRKHSQPSHFLVLGLNLNMEPGQCV